MQSLFGYPGRRESTAIRLVFLAPGLYFLWKLHLDFDTKENNINGPSQYPMHTIHRNYKKRNTILLQTFIIKA